MARYRLGVCLSKGRGAAAQLGVPNARALAALVDRVAALEKAVGLTPAESPPAAAPKKRAVRAPKAAPADAPKPAVRKAAARKALAPAPEEAAPAKTAARRRRAAA